MVLVIAFSNLADAFRIKDSNREAKIGYAGPRQTSFYHVLDVVMVA